MKPPDRDEELRRLVDGALELPTERWRPFLEAAASEPELAREAEALLHREAQGEDVVDTPGRCADAPETMEVTAWLGPRRDGGDTVSTAGLDEDGAPVAHPEHVGPYRIVRHLGSGGMGDVFLAEQDEPVQRRLAVKLIRTAWAHRSGHARFRAEQQAMARLAHPNVAKLFDAGTSEEGFPYFAMEYVDGAPLTTFASQQRLTVEQRIRLLVEVCRGVEHAHRRGILHRDLKPSNILVEAAEGRPTPRVIDFGIAKALEDPLTEGTLTVDRRPVGTPAYMSPEALAAEVDLDTRTDVYSLGVVLFELLVGCRPFQAAGSAAERWRNVRQAIGDPPRPSTRFRSLPKDEQTMAAEERRTGRRELARTLAGDLGWIAWTALAPDRDDRYGSVSELAEDLEAWLERRPIRAHPPSVAYRARKLVERHRAAAAATALAVAATIAGLVGTTVGFVRARAEADRASQEARTAREISDFLADLFEVADPHQSRGETVTARELLDRGSERIRTELADQPRTQARLMAVIGRVYVSLGLLEPAEGLLRDALERLEGTGNADPDLATVLDGLGYVLYKRNQNDDAAEMLEEAWRLRSRLLGRDHELTAHTLLRLGDVEEQRGRYEDAEERLGEALGIQQKVAPGDLAVAETLSRLAVVATRTGDNDRAIDRAERALEIHEAVQGPVHLDVAEALIALGSAQLGAGRPDRAASAFQRSLEIREEILGPDHPEVAQSLLNLAITSDDFEVAVPLLERALRIWEAALGPDHPRIATTLGNLAYYYLQERRLAEAAPLLERAYRISLQPGSNPRSRVDHLGTLGKIDMDLGRFERAEERLRGALRHAEEGAVPDDAWGAREALRKLAQLLRRTGRPEEAQPYVARWEAATGETFTD